MAIQIKWNIKIYPKVFGHFSLPVFIRNGFLLLLTVNILGIIFNIKKSFKAAHFSTKFVVTSIKFPTLHRFIHIITMCDWKLQLYTLMENICLGPLTVSKIRLPITAAAATPFKWLQTKEKQRKASKNC